jgi:hypothetical protein
MNSKGTIVAVLFFLTASAGVPSAFAQPENPPPAQSQPAQPQSEPPQSAAPQSSAPLTPAMIQANQMKRIDALLVQLAAAFADLRKFIAGGPAAFKVEADETAVQKPEPSKGPRTPPIVLPKIGAPQISTETPTPDAVPPALETPDEEIGRFKSECGKRFTTKDLAAKEIPNDDLVQYYECRAAAENKPKLCDELASFKFAGGDAGIAGPTGSARAERCTSRVIGWLTARAYISHASDAADYCKRQGAVLGFPAANLGRFCSIILGPDETAAVCAQLPALASKPLGPEWIKNCVLYLGAQRGDGSVCGKLDAIDVAGKRDCAAIAAYRKAQAAQDPKLCAGEPLCRLLSGDANVCRTYETKLRDSYCGDFAKEKFNADAPNRLAQNKERLIALEKQRRAAARNRELRVAEYHEQFAVADKARTEAGEKARLLAAQNKEELAKEKTPATKPKTPSRPTPRDLYAQALVKKQANVYALINELNRDIESFEPKSYAGLKARKEKFAARRAAIEKYLKEDHRSEGEPDNQPAKIKKANAR